jgi:hypothetical protein
MPIKVTSNNGNPIFSSSPLLTSSAGLSGGGGGGGGTSSDFLVDLQDVNKSGLNNNDVLVYDASTGKFIPIDKSVINDNDGGVF